MAKAKKDNRVKRKRGKKFQFHGDEATASKMEKAARGEQNPFENHSISKRAKKDEAARDGLIQEFKSRGRNSEFVDRRIGEKSSKMSEDDKMKLRYLKEQKDNLQKVAQTHKRQKYNLDDGSDDDSNLNFLTHGGKKIEDLDDFQREDISSEGEYEDRDMQKGIMTKEMVNELNFGRGDENEEEAEDRKKTREERHAEIMEKSKAYRYHAQEVKEATREATRQLDEEWADVAGLLNFGKAPRVLQKEKADLFDEVLTKLKTEGVRTVVPLKSELSEKERAQTRREKLERLSKKQYEADEKDEGVTDRDRKREAKAQSKRDQAIEASLEQQKKHDDHTDNMQQIQDKLDQAKANAKKNSKTAIAEDSDLQSSGGDGEDGSDSDEEADEGSNQEGSGGDSDGSGDDQEEGSDNSDESSAE